MDFLNLLRDESRFSVTRLALISAIAGLSNALLLALVNTAAEDAADTGASALHLAQFVVIVLIWVVAQRHAMTRTGAELEGLLHRVRVRIADQVRRADLMTFERTGRGEIYSALHRDTSTLSQASLVLLDGLQSALLVFFTALYIAWLSMSAFVLMILFVGLALSIYFKRRTPLRDAIREANTEESRLWELINGLLDGFKSVRLHRARSDDLHAHGQQLSRETMRLKVNMRHMVAGQFIFSQLAFFMLLGTVVFIAPRFGGDTYGDVVIKTTTAILFLIGPIGSLVGAIPVLSEANEAARNIRELEQRLSRGQMPEFPQSDPYRQFDSLELDAVTFRYPQAEGVDGFTIGPVSLKVKAGEIVFISGGNGAGKSSLLKLLTGLYRPATGNIRVNGGLLDDAHLEAYHALLAVVFSDFHLFRRLYGIQGATPDRIHELLNLLEIDEKTRVDGDTFSTTELSSGQRKRLALMVAILENRPIMVFDEWAADQDPHFRRRFYEELLPELRRQGKTIVAVTHDDRYYGVADRLYVMRDGQLAEEQRP